MKSALQSDNTRTLAFNQRLLRSFLLFTNIVFKIARTFTGNNYVCMLLAVMCLQHVSLLKQIRYTFSPPGITASKSAMAHTVKAHVLSNAFGDVIPNVCMRCRFVLQQAPLRCMSHTWLARIDHGDANVITSIICN